MSEDDKPAFVVENGGSVAPDYAARAAQSDEVPMLVRGTDGRFTPKVDKPADVKGGDAEDAKPADSDGDGGDDASDDHGSLPEGVRKRIARSNRQRDDARRSGGEMQSRLDELSGIVKALQDKQAKGELQPGDFDTYTEFEKARDAAAKPEKAPEATPKVDPEFVQALGDLQEAVEAVDSKMWAKVKKADVQISQAMVIALADADDPTASLQALLDDPAEAERIAKMSPRRQAQAVWKIRPAATDAATPKPKRVTATDDPPEPVRSRGVVSKSLDKMDTDEFIRTRNEQEGQGRDRFGW